MKFRITLLLSIISLMIISCNNPKEEIRKELNLGVKMLHRGQHTQAIQHLNLVIEMDSTQSEAHLYLGRAFFNQAKYPQSMLEYNAAIRFNEKYGEAYKSRAQLWFVLDNRSKSCEDYIKAEQLGVKNLDNYTRHCP